MTSLENTKRIQTQLGEVEVEINIRQPNKPVFLFLHGVFLGRSLWQAILKELPTLNSACIDMIAHGKSDSPNKNWSLEDCVKMLDDIIQSLDHDRIILVGHSWGGMSSLRYCAKHPNNILGLILINTPLRELSVMQKLGFRAQLLPLMISKKLYAHFAAKALYAKISLKQHPEFEHQIAHNFYKRSTQDIWRVIQAVLLNAKTAFNLYDNLKTPNLVIAGEEDYVLNTYIESGSQTLKEATKIVPGGHISPHESPKQVAKLINEFASIF